MRILLITDEEWNDVVYGNNVLTNWFYGFDAEFAQVYCSPGRPYNKVCKRYFQITDKQMLCSLFTGLRAGAIVDNPSSDDEVRIAMVNEQRVGIYKLLKKLSLFFHATMMIARDAIWMWGKYDTVTLERFVRDFRPDIVFCPRLITPKLMRLEVIISRMTNAPFVAFTADNEASLQCYSWSPLYWIRRLAIHHAFKKHVGLYRHYFMFSEEQAREYHNLYRLPTSCLYKCGDFEDSYIPKTLNHPIRIIYAGRLYCNRWKTLVAIGEALERLNQNKTIMELDVFSADILTRKQKKALHGTTYLHVHPAISPTQLVDEYKKADIALHVESFDKRYRLATHYSFSTKIIDLMASTCAIMAVCWERHAGYAYLKNNDAAFCVSHTKDLFPLLQRISQQTELVQEYAEKAWACGRRHHSRSMIQEQIKETFARVISVADPLGEA